MKVNSNIISIPPYLSTSWQNVRSLSVRDSALVIHLEDGEIISIPNLSSGEIEKVFQAHQQFLEEELELEKKQAQNPMDHFPFNFGIVSEDGESAFSMSMNDMNGLGMALQHNPAQANTPDLPKELLDRVGTIAKIMAPEDPDALPAAEPHCNCVYCQLARTIGRTATEKPAEEEDPIVLDEELEFCQWDVQEIGDKIFEVANRLDSDETYKVCLDPVGCTCGQEGCEHVITVLKTP